MNKLAARATLGFLLLAVVIPLALIPADEPIIPGSSLLVELLVFLGIMALCIGVPIGLAVAIVILWEKAFPKDDR